MRTLLRLFSTFGVLEISRAPASTTQKNITALRGRLVAETSRATMGRASIDGGVAAAEARPRPADTGISLGLSSPVRPHSGESLAIPRTFRPKWAPEASAGVWTLPQNVKQFERTGSEVCDSPSAEHDEGSNPCRIRAFHF